MMVSNLCCWQRGWLPRSRCGPAPPPTSQPSRGGGGGPWCSWTRSGTFSPTSCRFSLASHRVQGWLLHLINLGLFDILSASSQAWSAKKKTWWPAWKPRLHQLADVETVRYCSLGDNCTHSVLPTTASLSLARFVKLAFQVPKGSVLVFLHFISRSEDHVHSTCARKKGSEETSQAWYCTCQGGKTFMAWQLGKGGNIQVFFSILSYLLFWSKYAFAKHTIIIRWDLHPSK